MVSKSMNKKAVVVKAGASDGRLPVATAKGGLSAFEALANRIGLWSDCRATLPARRDPSQGFQVVPVVASLAHGLLSGGRGFSATEPMRDDAPLLSIIGVERAPSAETVEEVMKYHGAKEQSLAAYVDVLSRQTISLMNMEKRSDLLCQDGFVRFWVDGTLLETEGKNKDALLYIKKQWGQMAVAAFVGGYIVGCEMAKEKKEDSAQSNGEKKKDKGAKKKPVAMNEPEEEKKTIKAELEIGRGLLARGARVLAKTNLLGAALVLLDSLYGDGPTLSILEGAEFEGARYIVGANKLDAVEKTLRDQPESAWKDSTENTKNFGWEQSSVCQCWIQCEGWATKRLLIGRRYKKKGEFIHNYSGVITNISVTDERIVKKMEREKVCFEEALFRLYNTKQGMENQWKALLTDMGLHRMPCARAQVNEIFLCVAAMANNLAEGVRRLLLEKEGRSIALWRLRRDLIDLPATVARHARQVIVRVLDARQRLVDQWRRALMRLEAI